VLRGDIPQLEPWSAAAVRLLQGAVYAEDGGIWGVLLSSQVPLKSYFARIGLLLVIDEPEGLAYLRQLTEDELPEGLDSLPRLFRKTRLSYDETLLCVLLRDELRRFEEEDLSNERCVVGTAAVFERWRGLMPAQHDEVRLRRQLTGALARLEELGLVRKAGDHPPAWEIRRILKARLPVAELESLCARLLAAAGRSEEDPNPSMSNG
jgi:hypothetical protein